MMKFSSIVLAGGKSSRMKMNKALLLMGEKTFIEIIVDELDAISDEVIVVTNSPEDYSFLSCKLVKDIFVGGGPLAGIHAGLKRAKNQYSFVTACDMPFGRGVLAQKLIEIADGYDGVVPKKGEYLQPLSAVYAKQCIPILEKSLEENRYKISSFYPQMNFFYPDWEELLGEELAEKAFLNINTPIDLQEFKKHQE